MLSKIVFFLFFLNAVLRVDASDDEEKIRKMFNDNITRTDFANLLKSLIKLNEQRVNVLQKLYKLEDYGVLSEVLRSGGGGKQKDKDLTDMILVVLANNQKNLTKKIDTDSFIVDAIPPRKGQLQIPERRTGSETGPILSNLQKEHNITDQKTKNFHGSPYMNKKLHQKQKKLRFPQQDVLHTRTHPDTERFQVAPVQYPKFPKLRREPSVYHRLKDDVNPKPHANRIEPIQPERGQHDPNMDVYPDAYEDKMISPTRNENAKSPFHIKNNDDVLPELEATEFPRYVNPGKKRKERFEIDDGRGKDRFKIVQSKKKERFEIDDGKHSYTRKVDPMAFTVNKLLNEMQPHMPIKTSTSRPGEFGTQSNLVARYAKKHTEDFTEEAIKEKVRVTQMDVDFEPEQPPKSYQNTAKPQEKQKVDDVVTPPKTNPVTETTTQLQKIELKMGDTKQDYDIVSLEMGDGHPSKTGRDVIIENEDGVHYVQSDFEPSESIESRKNLQKCIGKKAEKLCIKSCNTAYKNVCRRLKCTKKAKKTLKKECKKSCKNTFKTSKSKDKGSKSDSDSLDE